MSLPRGFIILNKPKGISSQQAVTRVKKSMGFMKAGHTGTLDPLATGVLPVALGGATKVIPHLQENQKVYQVTGLLGVKTNTFDACGNVVAEQDWSGITQGDLMGCLARFEGLLKQVPPIFSAIKVKGQALYRYARRGEIVVPPTRKVMVYSIRLLSWSGPEFSLEIHCSKGTYIRSLIHDLGELLKVGAHVTQLKRIQTGPFKIEEAISLEDLENLSISEKQNALRPIEEFISHLEKIPLIDEGELVRVLAGVPLHRISDALVRGEVKGPDLALCYGSRVVALIEALEKGKFQYHRVLG